MRWQRRVARRSWPLAKIIYRRHGIRLDGRPDEPVWYFAFESGFEPGQPLAMTLQQRSGYRRALTGTLDDVTDTAYLRYRHYHTPEDTAEKLDYPRMARVVGALAGMLADLDARPEDAD